MDITEKEFNEYLAELGYQIQNKTTNRWERTPKGVNNSVKLFKFILWDIDTMFEVLKLRGKKTYTYFYCGKCGTCNKILDFDKNVSKHNCMNCGYEEIIQI